MALFRKQLKTGEHEVLDEGTEEVMHINYEGYSQIPSIEDDSFTMSRVVEKLAQSPTARIVFHQKKKYEYSYTQTQMLVEVAQIYNHFIKQKKILSQAALEMFGPLPDTGKKLQDLQYLFLNLVKTDPVGAFVECRRLLREEKINLEKNTAEEYKLALQPYIQLLTELYELLVNTKLLNYAHSYIDGYVIGNRDVYRQIFKAVISPDFMYTRLMATPPLDAEEIDAYALGKNSYVQIFNTKDTIKPLYHVIPPEFQVSEDKYELIEMARRVLAEHQPKAEEFTEPEKMRETFFNIGRDLLTELADAKHIDLSFQEIEEMANILVRYTVGFGLIETLLQDENIQDIAINSPPGNTRLFVVHGKYDECITNIIPSIEDVESWASKLRLISARPLDEANPILDTELLLPGVRARVGVISKPLNPSGLAFSIRRHRDKPWTFPLFIKNKMMNNLAAGLLSFLVDGNRTILVAGTRGSGKTSVLGSVLVEIMRKYRVITVEDTLELPGDALRELGYNIQQMKVRSALAKGGSELAADEGIRTSLRMGDSSLIVGEVRSTEALALYEAMRTGALANTVAGTIHGDSPYGVFDRVVNDLKVPRTSFKATDIIIIANPIRSADGLKKIRRITQITEVRKSWEDDPLMENGFVDLMKYDSKTDELVPTDALINGDSEILKSIGGQVKEWAGSWDAIWENIQLRAKIKQLMVEYAVRYDLSDILEAKTEIQMNDLFHRISERVKEETGFLDSRKILFEWEEELKRYIKLNYQR
ncbi:type II/IV secretion system ATPase subunit [Candidatus Woesearchaeota archaeon]|nr:type II/IV secretion system ATPase subunit [Candidatus Woesearchaeota archaeon]